VCLFLVSLELPRLLRVLRAAANPLYALITDSSAEVSLTVNQLP
jgi:hypothetical protein